MTELIETAVAAEAAAPVAEADETAETKPAWADKPFAPFATYPEGQEALLALMQKNVKMEFPFSIIPWKSLKPTLMPLLTKILIDG